MVRIWRLILLAVFLMTCAAVGATEKQDEVEDETYSEETIIDAASEFFGKTTKALAQAIEKVFEEQGRPNGYITGTEGGGAIGVGLRYGEGVLHTKRGGRNKVYWQGPSVGFDFGGNLSKVFTLVYHLGDIDDLFQRIPGVDGSLYLVGGISVNYQQTGDLILAPIRTGVGWRAGASIGYVHYTRKKSWIPF
ncbi:conserved hypothetical protein [Nitrosococcus halophilus Nc 4]|uniref:DUF1134 domain-containing protein n=1 Tax=Nitrosococcus halophilus (strain Nc4) TaxID=472759 RepID=D5C149_NITHN|nr:EipA family protein [Nitrosococcus halophilus]ADE14606.1 conserved hypothetical protein [Nitrosococcus halophilus Nc 4]